MYRARLIPYRVVGKLGKRGRATGTLKGSLETQGINETCRTGLVDWRAQKGDDLDSPFRGQSEPH